VIALARGGALETVVGPRATRRPRADRRVSPEPTAEPLADAVRAFEDLEPKLDAAAIRANATRFSLENFRAGIGHEIEEVLV
jgi:hypothetical protein